MRGGRREGAGRPVGSRWKPAAKALRADAVEKQCAIVNGDDPLSVVAAMVLDQSLDIGTRLSAANTCLPYLYPRLSQTHVDSRITVSKVDSADLLRRLDERIAHLAQPAITEAMPADPPPVIDGIAVGDDQPE